MTKQFHTKESKSFCMAPWVHLYSSPSGVAAPCCISESCTTEGVGNTRTQSLIEVVNSPKMNQLRKDMLNEVLNDECKKCHMHEKHGVLSSRNLINREYTEYYDEVTENTNEDGSLKEFKMRYSDIRFSNICNFKCRTCGGAFSSQWEQEDLKNNVSYARIYPKNDNPQLLNDVVEQIPNLKVAYFAGGEPLITEEHYVLLEEMIRQGRTDIELRYNTNMSNMKFKNKDVLELWKHFKNGVNIWASIDHYGERAEYIRHGTDWATVEENLINAKAVPFINVQINTVLSVFNYMTIGDFYQYLIDKKFYLPTDHPHTLYNMSTPEHYACHILPPEYKIKGREGILNIIKVFTTMRFKRSATQYMIDSLKWSTASNTWETEKDTFRSEIERIDMIRNEDFRKTFPELAPLLDTL